MPSSQYYIIYSPPFGWSAPLYSPPKRCEQHQPKTGCVGEVLGNPPLIAGASTTIGTRFISRAAPLCTNLDGNLCPTLTAHSEPLLFSELAETGSRQIIHTSQYSNSFGMSSARSLFTLSVGIVFFQKGDCRLFCFVFLFILRVFIKE